MKKIMLISLVIVMVFAFGCNTVKVFPQGKTMDVGDGRLMNSVVEGSF